MFPWQEAGSESVAPAPERQTGHGTGSDPRTDLARKTDILSPEIFSIQSESGSQHGVLCSAFAQLHKLSEKDR